MMRTARLVLEPLAVGHASEMAALLDDPALYAFIGGGPATVEELRERYVRQVVGRSPDGSERWLNWVVRGGGAALGYVQATVTSEHAELAWVIGPAHQGRGYAREAAAAVATWLHDQGVERLVAHIRPDHTASQSVARALGLRPTGTVADGEVRWERPPATRRMTVGGAGGMSGCRGRKPREIVRGAR